MYTGIVGYLIIVVLNIWGYITIAIYKEERRTIEFDDLEKSEVKYSEKLYIYILREDI